MAVSSIPSSYGKLDRRWHNRYTIAKKHPEIPFTVHEKEFASRYEAIIWICKNQLGRRNLTPEQKKYLIGKQYEAEKFNHGGDQKKYLKNRLAKMASRLTNGGHVNESPMKTVSMTAL